MKIFLIGSFFFLLVAPIFLACVHRASPSRASVYGPLASPPQQEVPNDTVGQLILRSDDEFGLRNRVECDWYPVDRAAELRSNSVEFGISLPITTSPFERTERGLSLYTIYHCVNR